MRGVTFLVSIGAIGIAQAQWLPVLEKPEAVDIRVTTMQWHPSGQSLIYVQDDADQAKQLGVYSLGQLRGRPLIHLGREDQFAMGWFSGKPNALVVVRRPFSESGQPMVRLEAHLVDFQFQVDRVIFNRAYPQKDRPDLNVDESPTLLHAIVRLRVAGQRQHFILKTGSFDLIPSPDLDRAVASGLSGPTWTIDGTAAYGQGVRAPEGEMRAIEKLLNERITALEREAVMERLKRANGILDASTMRVFAAPSLQEGSTVMEVMPQNGVLRAVRYRGPWVETPKRGLAIETITQPFLVDFGRSKGQGVSLWLTALGTKAESGTLITPNARQAWTAPNYKAVAYVTDGALFIRRIVEQKQ